MPPVGLYVSALRVTRERTTASRQGPSKLHELTQFSHHTSVSRMANSASTGRGGSSCDGNHVRTNGTRSPADTVKSATVVMSLPSVCTGDHKVRPSGPATAVSRQSKRRTHGTIDP